MTEEPRPTPLDGEEELPDEEAEGEQPDEPPQPDIEQPKTDEPEE